MGKQLEGVDIPVIHIVRIRHTLVRIGPVFYVACTRETRCGGTRVGKEVTLAIFLQE